MINNFVIELNVFFFGNPFQPDKILSFLIIGFPLLAINTFILILLAILSFKYYGKVLAQKQEETLQAAEKIKIRKRGSGK